MYSMPGQMCMVPWCCGPTPVPGRAVNCGGSLTATLIFTVADA